MSDDRETIAACATAAGTGGVAIVRVSGPRALAIAAAVTGRAAAAWEDRRLVRVRVRDAAGRRVDDGLAVAMRGPRSFTGEDVVELHVHGGAVNVGAVLEAVVAAGARLAEPGEFTRRGLDAGKVSVAEAEAMLAVVSAPSARAWALAQAQLAGALARTVAAQRETAAGVLAELEARIDFPEEDVEPADRAKLGDELARLEGAAAALERSFVAGRALTDGVVVAVVGAVNAGKSALVNALVGAERVLVSDEPGTTRDYVEVRALWDGVSVTLVDTAGEREAAADVERRGIDLGRSRASTSDLRLRVVGPEDAPARTASSAPGGTAATAGDGASAAGAPRELRVASKVDLGWDTPAEMLRTSAKTGEGVAALRAAIVAEVGLADDAEAGSSVLLTERQRSAAAAARTGFAAARAGLASGAPLEVVAIDARSGAAALASLAGEEVGEDVLDALFRRFCIGK
ncbi:MAG TPA: GTPase [Kofleriaceae bacterium]|nr:GTPase [Kofleriaceae bacterium]